MPILYPPVFAVSDLHGEFNPVDIPAPDAKYPSYTENFSPFNGHMKTIPTTFTKSEWLHTQRLRVGMVAIYERKKESSPAPHWETIIIKAHEEYEMGGHTIEAGESYPGPTSFGTLGWTYPSYERALAKLRSLTATPTKKPKPRPQV